MARPPKVPTPEQTKALCALFQNSHYADTACAKVGINERTFYRWMEKGAKAKSGVFSQFCQAIKLAQAESEIIELSEIKNAAMGKDGQAPSWQARAWILERRYPQKWGRKIRAEVSGPAPSDANQSPIPIENTFNIKIVAAEDEPPDTEEPTPAT